MIRFLLICFCIGVHSLANAGSWGALTPMQQEVLVNYRSVWHLIPAEEQSVLESGAFRVGKADQKSLKVFQDAYKKWVGLSSGERGKLRARWDSFMELPIHEQRSIKMGLRQLKKLPREKREFVLRLMLREEGL